MRCERAMRKQAIGVIVVLAVIGGLLGCHGSSGRFMTNARQNRGLVVILPGIEGPGALSDDIVKGLDAAGVPYALKVQGWGRPVPLAGMLLNQVDVLGNRVASKRIANTIIDYQDRHPGAPVYLLGHSGGGGIAIFVAEALPPGRRVDGVILLSPSISDGYDLSKALGHTRKGVVNFWSPEDVGLLVFGTSIVGNMDGAHSPAAGASGFHKTTGPASLFGKLYQVQWNESMAQSGNSGGHMDSTNSRFVTAWIAPWVTAADWPAPPVNSNAPG